MTTNAAEIAAAAEIGAAAAAGDVDRYTAALADVVARHRATQGAPRRDRSRAELVALMAARVAARG